MKDYQTKIVALTLPEPLLERLDRFAFDEHRNRSNAAQLLLAEALDRLERPAAELAESLPEQT
jgi:metal-responsive CopG/Arc/MetJ family transcriptional regulator